MRFTRVSIAFALLLVSSSAAAQPTHCPVEIVFEPFCGTQGMAGTNFRPGVNCRWLMVDGFPREYLVYVSESEPSTSGWPLVMMTHGTSGDGEKFLNISGWKEKADEVGLVVVFPTALPAFVVDASDEGAGKCSTKWHELGLEAIIDENVTPALVAGPGAPLLYSSAAPWPANDVGFVRAMLDDVEAGLPIDERREYMTGFSNGAAFAARVTVEIADKFAAAAIVGGHLSQSPAAPAVRHLPTVVVRGTCDLKAGAVYGLPFDQDACVDGTGPGLPIDPDALEEAAPLWSSALAVLLEAAGLEAEPSLLKVDSRLGAETYRRPRPGNVDGSEFRFVLQSRVTHQYPRCLGPGDCNNPLGFHVADDFWRFFKVHRKPLTPAGR